MSWITECFSLELFGTKIAVEVQEIEDRSPVVIGFRDQEEMAQDRWLLSGVSPALPGLRPFASLLVEGERVLVLVSRLELAAG